MALFDKTKKPFSYDVIREGDDVMLSVNLEDYQRLPSIEDDPVVMSKSCDLLTEVKDTTKIIFLQKRNYEYDYSQISTLKEISSLYNKLAKRKEVFSYTALLSDSSCSKWVNVWYSEVQDIISNLLRSDPVGAYVELIRIARDERIKAEKSPDDAFLKCSAKYLKILEYIISLLENTKLIALTKPYLAGHKVGDREVYRRVFSASIRPDFMFTKIMASFPHNGEEIDHYIVGKDIEVTVFELPDNVQYLYHVLPPEFKLTEEKYEILDTARKIMAEHKPRRSEFVEPDRMRQVFFNVGSDLIDELASQRSIAISTDELEQLTDILVRYTVGFGLIEVLLQDEKIQDITVNNQMGEVPMFIVHQDYGECRTNIIPTASEAESWATKLRLISGRPLDEANPVLDTEIMIKGANARVAAVGEPLNPFGLAFAFRRHRDKPWTLPLFIDNRMISPLAAGLLSFLIDGNRTLLVAGTRSAGKTSLLGSLLVEVMRKYRVLTIEDTLELPVSALRRLGYNIQPMKVAAALAKGSAEVPADEGIRTTLRMGDSALIVGEIRSSLRGNQDVVIVDKGLTKRIAIKNLENLNLKSIYLPTLTSENKMELKQISGFVKHPKRGQLIKLTTKTGRSVIVTPDHSVFTHVNFKIAAINTDQLRHGDPIIIPSKISNVFNDINYINLLEIFKERYRLENAEPYIRKAIKVLGWRKASKICEVADIYQYLLSTQKTRIPINSFLKLMQEAQVKYNIKDLRIKRGTANSIPVKFPINEKVLRFIGYYLAEGNIDINKIQITNSKPEIIEDVADTCEKEFGLKVSKRKIKGLGYSIQMFIRSKPLSDLLVYLGCGKTSLNKRIPEFVYGLNEKKICALLKGMFSGDGSFSSSKNAGNIIRYSSTAKKLVEDVAYALLSIGIVCRIHNRKSPIRGYRRIYNAEIKQRKYVEYFLKNVGFTHKNPKITIKSVSRSKDDSVFFDPKELEKHLKLPRKYRHLRKTKRCSKEYLKKITEEVKCSDELYDFAHGDFFVDRVKSIEIINLKKPEHVYDLEVKSTQRFIGGFGGILLHNTEATALYEAMRVGALANVVAGTIHGDSPYGVFDRVVNDLGVQRTSFKATDVIIVANPIRTPDGLHRWRRVTQITEVRKQWENDPLLENGFVDLMKYNTKTDQLEPTDELINGDSEILKGIAGNVKEWAGSWDAVWENILLRAKVKETIVNTAQKSKMMELLEADFIIEANDAFHKISDSIRQEIGKLDSKRIFFEWNEWLKRSIKKKNIKEE